MRKREFFFSFWFFFFKQRNFQKNSLLLLLFPFLSPFLKSSFRSLGIAPLMIVGYEGLIGAFLMLGVLLPIVSILPGKDGDGIHEDTADTWHVSRIFLTFLLLL